MEDIKIKILGLMSKTLENGCTEAEAMAASKKVQELLNRYQLSLSDIKIKESKCVTGEYDTQLRAAAPTQYCLYGIGKFTDVMVWFHTSDKHRDGHDRISYKFFGLEHDVLIAEYITKLCDWAIIYDGEDFKRTDTYSLASKRSKVLLDFRVAMAQRISKKLMEMKEAQEHQNASDGRSLVVVKGAIITEEFAKLRLRLYTARMGHQFSNAEAYNAGTAAGDRLNINPGVTQGTRRPELA